MSCFKFSSVPWNCNLHSTLHFPVSHLHLMRDWYTNTQVLSQPEKSILRISCHIYSPWRPNRSFCWFILLKKNHIAMKIEKDLKSFHHTFCSDFRTPPICLLLGCMRCSQNAENWFSGICIRKNLCFYSIWIAALEYIDHACSFTRCIRQLEWKIS